MRVPTGIMKIVQKHLHILGDRSNIDKWKDSTFEVVKKAPKTPQGDFGEYVTRDIIRSICKLEAERINEGKGDFDILVATILEMEHKLATEDSNNMFQFNNIKKKAIYDYVFTLGVSPEHLWFNIWSKNYIVVNCTTHMSKNAGDSYKFSATANPDGKHSLLPLTVKNLKKEVAKIV